MDATNFSVKLPQAVLVGYFPKVTQSGTDWLGNESVLEICSVSHCISEGPDGWINQWKHNELGFYDSEEIAYQVIEENPSAFHLYAYKMYPLSCLQGKTKSALIPSAIASQVAALSTDYELLGYDIVTKSTSSFFECSPLSCNSAAAQYPVNRYCLIATEELAYQALTKICEKGTYEPGPYFLFEVYRKHLS
jgi:hypothetical protein